MAGRIPEQFIDSLIARVDIVDLIESYIPLKKAGREYHALCPFHGEKTPSFTVSREKQFYHCFGCAAHGSAIGFLMNYRNLEFREAVEELAQIAGVEIPVEAQGPSSGNTRLVYEANEKACKRYEQLLRKSEMRERAVGYLKGRGISGEIAKQFRIGFAPDGWRNLYDALRANEQDDNTLERAGLIIKRDRGGFYDRFRDRIMFPIRDRRGRVIGFGGRIIDDGEPKYLNSPETEVFHKGRELYGLHEAMQQGTPQELMIVEGYMDVIALHQFGLKHAVATLGTAVTDSHLESIFRHVPSVVFCFDGDAAGQRAAWKALETALPKMSGNREVKFCFLPDGHDPDSAVREFGAENFLTSGQNFSLAQYLIRHLASDVDTGTSEGRARLVAKVIPYLKSIPDDTHRAIGTRLLAEAARLGEDLIRGEIGFGQQQRRSHRRPQTVDRYTRRTLQEQALAMLIQHPRLASLLDEEARSMLGAELHDCEGLLHVHSLIGANAAISSAVLLERFRDDPRSEQLEQLAMLDINIPDEALSQEFSDAISRLQQAAEKARFNRITSIPVTELTDEQKLVLRNFKQR